MVRIESLRLKKDWLPVKDKLFVGRINTSVTSAGTEL